MKKILLTIAFAITLMLPSVAQVWTFETLTAEKFTDTRSVGDFSIEAGGKEMKIVASSVTVGDDTYSAYLNSGGKSSTTQRLCKFPVAGPGTIEIVCKSNGTDVRNFSIRDSQNNILETIGSTSTWEKVTVTYNAGADNLVIWFDASINIAMVSYTAGSVTPELVSVSPEADEKNVEIESVISFTYNVPVNEPSVTVNGNAVTLTTDNDKTFVVSDFELTTATDYLVSVSATTTIESSAEVAGKEWSFSTIDPNNSPVELTTDAKVWNVEKPKDNKIPAANEVYIIDETLLVYTTKDQDSNDKGIKLDKIQNGNYMMFALPANVSGTLSLTARASSSKDIYYQLSSSWNAVPTDANDATFLGSVVDPTELSATITTTEETYVYIFHTGGNAYYKDITWTPIYEENLVSGNVYYLRPTVYNPDDVCAAYFINKNTNTTVKVEGEAFIGINFEGFAFYLDPLNITPVTRAEVPAYTHIVFERNGAEVTTELYYPTGVSRIYNEEEAAWNDISTSIDRVEVAGGIAYANGVVTAEGAIEVYNVGGAIVARGNDNVDLRGLNAGVYIVRNGNQVRKVVR